MRMSLVALVVALLAPSTFAEIMVAESVEWMTNNSPLVVVGKVQMVKDEGDRRDITIAIKEVIKGNLQGKSLAFSVTLPHYDVSIDRSEASRWKDSQAELLLFLRKATRAYDGKEMDGRWTLRSPHLKNFGNPAIDLSKPHYVYSMDMTDLEKSEDILKLVREWARKSSPAENAQRPNIIIPPKGSLALEIPPDSTIFRSVYAGSSCFLLVPAVEKFKQRVIDMTASKHPEIRAKGALLLANYPGDDTKAVLQKLLDDKAQVYVAQTSGETIKTVAKAAEASLEELRKPPASQPATQPAREPASAPMTR